MLKAATATPIGRLAMSDHAMSAVEEMSALHDAFSELKQQAGIMTPNCEFNHLKMLLHHVIFA